VYKRQVQGRRQWDKVRLAMDTATSNIRAVKFTPSRDGDGPVLQDRLGQTREVEQINTVIADDARVLHERAQERLGHIARSLAVRPRLYTSQRPKPRLLQVKLSWQSECAMSSAKREFFCDLSNCICQSV